MKSISTHVDLRGGLRLKISEKGDRHRSPSVIDGASQEHVVWELVPAKFVRLEHVQEVLRCRCGGCVVTAPGAPKVIEKGQYGASFLAHLFVAKYADHLPIYRIEKELARKGMPSRAPR